ncbi:hypothetical protein HDU97_005050 [Phlyctochytrium planicorne]|nr:hypothetical protein HDU97_005050 [Phlyctochytrium planicorne]
MAIPRCGTDGVTYITDCEFNKAKCSNPKLEVAYPGECSSKAACSNPPRCQEPQQGGEVCGSDGKTYESECLLLTAQCTNRDLVKIKDGPCGATGGSPSTMSPPGSGSPQTTSVASGTAVPPATFTTDSPGTTTSAIAQITSTTVASVAVSTSAATTSGSSQNKPSNAERSMMVSGGFLAAISSTLAWMVLAA